MAEQTRDVVIGEAPAPLTERASRPSPFPDRAARHWILSAIFWLTVVDLFGLVLATEFVTPEAFGGISWLSFSRIRPSHVSGVILAWLTMMYFGALFYMLPRLVGTRGMWSERLGVWCAWAWNLMYLFGIIGLLTGHSQGREYGEFIWPVDIALLVIWLANIVNILGTVSIRTIRPIYVSVWFFIASPIWLAVDYAIGNVIWRPGNVWGAPSGALSGSLSDDVVVEGAHAVKTLWAVSRAYPGALLIRGRRLGDGAVVRFWPGRQRRLWWRGLWPEERRAWRYGVTATLIPRRGCYAFQVDGATFSRRIVFAVS